MKQLLDCPFCGHNLNKQDWMDTVYPQNREMTLWQVVCQDCSATMLGEAKEDAINNWNTRHIEYSKFAIYHEPNFIDNVDPIQPYLDSIEDHLNSIQDEELLNTYDSFEQQLIKDDEYYTKKAHQTMTTV